MLHMSGVLQIISINSVSHFRFVLNNPEQPGICILVHTTEFYHGQSVEMVKNLNW
jgi:hypothetical protein